MKKISKKFENNINNNNMDKYFYEVHVNIPRNGYSFAVESDKPLSDDEVISLGIKMERFEETNDADCVDYVGEITEHEYKTMI